MLFSVLGATHLAVGHNRDPDILFLSLEFIELVAAPSFAATVLRPSASEPQKELCVCFSHSNEALEI